MMPQQHLSDQAVAACADGVLTGHARTRAQRHCAECAECAEAVRGQREAVMVLRDAPAPALPTDLLDRLRGLPTVTPIASPPTVVMPDGTTMLATGDRASGLSAFAPPSGMPAEFSSASPSELPRHRSAPWTTSLAVVALAGALATGAAVGDPGGSESTEPAGNVVQVKYPAPQPATPLRGAVGFGGGVAAFLPDAGAR